eukprot:3106743-Ditylum_brightwellii.AAC.2
MAHVEHTMHVTNHLGRHIRILDRGVLQVLGIGLEENSITWGDCQADMKSADVILAEYLDNIGATKAAAADISKLLDDKYEMVDLHKDIVDQCDTLNNKDKEKLLHVLQKHKELFDSTLGR